MTVSGFLTNLADKLERGPSDVTEYKTWALLCREFMAHAAVRNLGPASIAEVSVRLRAPAGVVMRRTTAKLVRGLGPGATAVVGWSLCGWRPGAYLVFAEATFGHDVIDSPARLLTVTPGGGTCGGGRSAR